LNPISYFSFFFFHLTFKKTADAVDVVTGIYDSSSFPEVLDKLSAISSGFISAFHHTSEL